MEKRYEGFVANDGLYVLDTFSGEVKFISHNGITTTNSESKSTITATVNHASPNSVRNEFSSFEQEVISAYPYLIARPFSDLLGETDSRMKCKLMVDTFTAILKYMSLQLASEYIRAPELKDVQIHQTLTKDLSRPLISAWNLLIARSLPVFRDKGIRLFSPEMKNAYEKLESKCKDPFLVTQAYSDENGTIKNKTKKLGKIQALINYRNGLAHGFNQSKERAQKEFDEYYPILVEILQELRYMSRYTLWHVESSKNGVNGIRLMGSNPSQSKVDFIRDGVNPAISPLFIINDSSGEILPLYAFFDIEQTNEVGLPEIGKDVFVFEGSTKNTVIYLSSSGEHLEKTTRFLHWKDLLAQKQMDVEIVDEKNLTIEILHSLGKHISSNAIQALVSSGKYLREATVERQDLNELLDSFCSSDFNGFVLGGESGIGKSTLLAQKSELWQNEGHMAVLYRGSALNQADIASKFLRDCALKLNYLEDFLILADKVFSESNRNCYLIIDALNEYSSDINDLIMAVENIVAQSSNYKWFKIIVSIRDSAYGRTNAKFEEIAFGQYFKVQEEKNGEKISSNVVRLKPVSKNFTEQLYNAYRDFKWKEVGISDDEGIYKFRPLTTFSELDSTGSTIELLRNPLMTRLILQSFHRSKLPSQLKNDEAMRLYLDNIIIEKTNESAGFPERLKLLSLLVRELDKQNTERLERDSLVKMDSFKTYLINTQKDSPYIQLLELGVLMEEWEKDDCYVRFAFDRFLEFMLAELHFSKTNDAGDLIKLFNRISEFKILQGAVEIIILRFCNNDNPEVLIELSDLADNEPLESQELIIELVANILFSLANENAIQFESIINRFPDSPGCTDLKVLISLVDKFYVAGDFHNFNISIHIAQKEADFLKNEKVMTDLILFEARCDLMQGRYSHAREKLESIKSLKIKIQDMIGLTKVYTEMGALERLEDNLKLSLEYNEKALELSKNHDLIFLQAEILNNTANSKKTLGFVRDAISLYDESLEICNKIADKVGIARVYYNKAIMYKTEGLRSEALEMYQKSLVIFKQLGEKRRSSYPLNGIAEIKSYQGEFEEAEVLYIEALAIRRQVGDTIGVSEIVNNIGSLYEDQGKYLEAEKFYLEAMAIRVELGSRGDISASLFNLGNLRKRQGEYEQALKLYQESLEIRRQLGYKMQVSAVLNCLGLLSFENGKFKDALLYYLEALNIKVELGDSVGVIHSIHRSFSLMSNDERETYFKEAKSHIGELTNSKELNLMTNIELMHYCLSNTSIDKEIIQEKISETLIQKELTIYKDIDNSPIEAFYCTSLRLMESSETELAGYVAEQALKIIGELRSIRKQYFQDILNRNGV